MERTARPRRVPQRARRRSRRVGAWRSCRRAANERSHQVGDARADAQGGARPLGGGDTLGRREHPRRPHRCRGQAGLARGACGCRRRRLAGGASGRRRWRGARRHGSSHRPPAGRVAPVDPARLRWAPAGRGHGRLTTGDREQRRGRRRVAGRMAPRLDRPHRGGRAGHGRGCRPRRSRHRARTRHERGGGLCARRAGFRFGRSHPGVGRATRSKQAFARASPGVHPAAR